MAFGIGGAIVVQDAVWRLRRQQRFRRPRNSDPKTPRRRQPRRQRTRLSNRRSTIWRRSPLEPRYLACSTGRRRPSAKPAGTKVREKRAGGRSCLSCFSSTRTFLPTASSCGASATILNLGERLLPEQRIWLDLVSGRYTAPSGDFDELARRMDVVPPSIVLAAVGRMQSGAQVAGRGAKAAVAERAALIRQVLGETPHRLELAVRRRSRVYAGGQYGVRLRGLPQGTRAVTPRGRASRRPASGGLPPEAPAEQPVRRGGIERDDHRPPPDALRSRATAAPSDRRAEDSPTPKWTKSFLSGRRCARTFSATWGATIRRSFAGATSVCRSTKRVASC